MVVVVVWAESCSWFCPPPTPYLLSQRGAQGGWWAPRQAHRALRSWQGMQNIIIII